MATYPKIPMPKNVMGTMNSFKTTQPNLKNTYSDVAANKKVRFKKLKEKLNLV